MAKANAAMVLGEVEVSDGLNPEGDLTTGTENWAWETVVEEAPSRVIFDAIGDTFIGQYVGMEHIDQPPNDKGEDQSFDLFNFRGKDGGLYAVNTSYKLNEAMGDKVNPGDWVRITYVKDLPTNRKQNPMKDFRVDVRQ